MADNRMLAAEGERRYMAVMKVKDAEILIIPGYTNSGPAHWQTRWEQRLSSARRVEQADWHAAERDAWTGAVAEAVNAARKPVVLVAHSLGVAATIQALSGFRQRVAGAFLVAPPDVDNPAPEPAGLADFGPYPRSPLPFPSILVASRNDPWCDFAVAEDIAAAWGSMLVDAGEAGHLNTDSGYGPWPEGSMVFAQFLTRLS
jgi:predicted alpha/beta hydrolase family esterase